MKANEVLNRYANGERDFRRANLQGQSFKGQDLSGADFTEADIRGANFTNAILRENNFTGARAGLKASSKNVLLFFTLFLSMISGFISAILGGFAGTLINDSTFAPFITFLVVFFILLVVIIQGNLEEILITAYLILGTSVFLAGILYGMGGMGQADFYKYLTTLFQSPYNVVLDATTPLLLLISIAALIFPSIITKIISSYTKFVFIYPFFMLLGSFCFSIFFYSSRTGFRIQGIYSIIDTILILVRGLTSFEDLTVAILITLFSILISLYVGFYAVLKSKNLNWFFEKSILLTTLGGTSFRGADLTEANFTKAILKSTDFTDTWKKDDQGKRQKSKTILEWVCWHKAEQLDRARVGNSILENPAVRELLVTRNGYKKSYIGANLRAVNLDGVNLEQATLRGADLSCSTLRQANLKNAELTEALVVGTELTGASLTGACLEDWNISSYTNLEDVDCQYVYLLRNQQERRPSSGDFAPGEFTKLFQEALNTVDLIFRNGVDWKAFVAAFQTVQVNNDGTELTIQSIENKGDGVVVVRVSVPETADKAKIHGEFNQNYDLALKALEAKYHAELKAKDEQITIYREKSADMTEILRLLANRPVTVEVNTSAESKAMSDSTDESQSVNIGGNVIGSTINLGAISGSVSNVVNQLPNAPDPAQPGIKELLVELQAAIESDADLPEKGKASALEQVKVLAEVAQNPEQPEKKGLGSQAVTFFKNAASFLPDTAKLAEAVSKLLPLITRALGLPF